MPATYRPLAAYLATQPPGATVVLPLPQIKALLGAPLPASARRTAFWTNLVAAWGAAAPGRAGCWVIRVMARTSPAVVVFAHLLEERLERL